MKDPKIKIQLTNTDTQFYWDVTVGNETFRMGYHGGTIETKKYGRYFLDTPYHGVTSTQGLFKLEPVEFTFSEVTK